MGGVLASRSSFLPRRRRSCLSGVVTSRTVTFACCMKAQEPCAIAAGQLDSDALQLTEGAHPGEHLAIALPGRGEGSCSDDPILFVDDRCDVKILVGIDAADDATSLLR